jgi:hypothetical protein
MKRQKALDMPHTERHESAGLFYRLSECLDLSSLRHFGNTRQYVTTENLWNVDYWWHFSLLVPHGLQQAGGCLVLSGQSDCVWLRVHRTGRLNKSPCEREHVRKLHGRQSYSEIRYNVTECELLCRSWTVAVREFICNFMKRYMLERYRKSVKHNKRWFLLLHKATSFDPTMGSSSGDYIRIREMKSTRKTRALRDTVRFTWDCSEYKVSNNIYIYIYIYIYIWLFM